jgi:hypothetical protein
MPLPQIGWQSLSMLAYAPGGQQPSPLIARRVGTLVQAKLQLLALPVK